MKIKLTGILSVAVAASIMVSSANALTIKVQASSKAGDWAHKFMTERYAPKLKAMTGGSLAITVLPTKSVVPYKETIDAVASGILDGDLNAISYFSGRDPAFAMIGDLIAGWDTPEQLQKYCMTGGGKEMLQKMYDTLKVTAGKIHVIGCSPYSREALVSKTKITTVAGLKGVKIRSPEGLAAEVFRLVGAAPSALPFSEVYTSLEKGIVDAADASAYINNTNSGMHKVAKFPIYPGIHSMANLQFIMNKKKWNKLSKGHQTALEVWYIAAYTEMRRAADVEDKEQVAKDKAGGDITVIDWVQEERDKFRKIAVNAWENFAKKSPLAREALNSQLAFMKKMGML